MAIVAWKRNHDGMWKRQAAFYPCSGQPDRMPARPGIGANRAAAGERVSAHLPDRRLAARVLKKDVRTACAGSDGVPTRPGIGADRPAADQIVPVHLPDRNLARAFVLKQDVGKAVMVEIAGSNRLPGRPGVGSDRPAANE